VLPIVVPLIFDGIITFSPDDLDTLAALVALILAAGGLGWMIRRTRR
jgi:hypothetical protein